jgi:17beta-estradiol 17-dehydrogenase / very-long-chain 3-oxoacyl-CoA reductase
VVTGASDGIGKEFALQLAVRRFNVILVARNAALLGAVGEEIRALAAIMPIFFLFDVTAM